MTEPLPDVSRVRGQASVTVEGAAPSAETLQQIREDVAWLSATLAKLFVQLPGPTARSTDLAQTLGVDKPLGSRLFRIARSTDPAEAVGLLPTVNQLLRAVRTAAAKVPGRRRMRRWRRRNGWRRRWRNWAGTSGGLNRW